MPISYGGQYSKQLKLLPLHLNSDGSAVVTVRFGYVDADNVFTGTSESSFAFGADEVASILDVPGNPALSRRDDLSLAIYQLLVESGKVPPGTVT